MVSDTFPNQNVSIGNNVSLVLVKKKFRHTMIA